MTIIEQLGLSPHPEGGHFRETIRLADGQDGRSRMTAILFLLQEGERSHWHRVDADEVWLWHSGTSLTLRIEGNEPVTLGADLSQGQELQAIVPAGAWQSAEVNSGWALVTCIVTPGFNFSGFELAPPNWSPG
ncbi:cupin domain-containing protein [Sphingomonas sp. UV9]|uniref:cupin domain-containing protein n=1 Tax=Sphingomonas sp. UV9 TaxID=1851410 RepID=UPI000FFBB29C|nr:cupin domain-containing protein [Sphingomonas sp. UV9]RXD06637.1 cupin domain-containing protein [Sphingomonas sp. UV9]